VFGQNYSRPAGNSSFCRQQKGKVRYWTGLEWIGFGLICKTLRAPVHCVGFSLSSHPSTPHPTTEHTHPNTRDRPLPYEVTVGVALTLEPRKTSLCPAPAPPPAHQTLNATSRQFEKESPVQSSLESFIHSLIA
jgi:hypothetical protein